MNKQLHSILLALFCFCLSTSFATSLTKGDLAFTGLNSVDNTVNGTESNREFSFILLKAVDTGTEIYFTDFGWLSSGGFQTALPCGANSGAVSDGIIKWTANSALPYGTQIMIRCKFTPSTNIGSVIGLQSTYNSSTQFLTVSSTETIFAFQGSISSPVLISALNKNGSWASSLSTCDYNPTASTLPSILSNSGYSFALSGTNARLKTTVAVSTDPAEARLQVYNASNWETSSNAYLLPPTSTLPVILKSFEAKANSNFSSLSFSVGIETNCKEYIIYRSNNGVDFEPIFTLASQNLKGSNSTYQFIDKHPFNNTNYYQLTYVDLNGSTTVLGNRTVKHSIEKQINIYPNPAISKTTLSFPENVYTEMQLFDLKGNILQTHQIPVTDSNKTIDLENLEKGIYIVSLKGKEKNTAIKFLKQ